MPCAADASRLAPAVSETIDGKPIPFSGTLQPGVWANMTITSIHESRYLKFYIPPSLSSSCPIITIEIMQEIGQVNAYVSARSIPNFGRHDFIYHASAPSTVVICPTQPYFYYGTYYIHIQSQDWAYNEFALRYRISSSPQCLTPTEETLSAPSTFPSYPGSIWLEDGVAETIESYAGAPETYHYFQLYAPGQCSNFSVSAMSTEGTDMLVTLYVATGTDVLAPNQTSMSQQRGTAGASWLVPSLPRASVNVKYCDPSPNATENIFYIGIKLEERTLLSESEKSLLRSVQVVATTQQYTPNIALSALAYAQLQIDLSYGTAPVLSCPQGSHLCLHYAYPKCYRDPVGCCNAFFPVAPEKTPHSLWPWNGADESVDLAFVQDIPWNDFTPRVPGKLAWALYKNWRTPNTTTAMSPISDPSKCTVTLGWSIVGEDGEVPNQFISFSEPRRSCDQDAFAKVDLKMGDLNEQMLQAPSNRDLAALAATQLKMVIASWDHAFDACRAQMSTFMTMTRVEEYSSRGEHCLHTIGSPEWQLDPCCNYLLFSTLSCIPTSVSRTVELTAVTKSSLLLEECRNPSCSQSYANAYADNWNHLKREESGCTARLYAAANVPKFSDSREFHLQCQRKVDLRYTLAPRCSSSEDCYKGAPCNMTLGRCVHTPADAIDCFANQIPYDTAVALFNIWGVTGEPTPYNLLHGPITPLSESHSATTPHPTNISAHSSSYLTSREAESEAQSAPLALSNSILAQRWFNTLCVGYTARKFRMGFTFARSDPTCIDDCSLRAREPFCLYPASNSVCPMPPDCDINLAKNSSICHRNWTPVYRDNEACQAHEICNWRRNETYPCMAWQDQTTCKPLCESSSETPQVCVDGSRDIIGTFLEIPEITTKERCEIGLCTTNATEIDSSRCLSTGVCTVPCGPSSISAAGISPIYPEQYFGCSSKQTCESSMRCSDRDIFGASYAQSGVCIMPRTWDSAFTWCNEPGWTLTPWTCVNNSLDESNCAFSAPGAYWYTLATDQSSCTGASAQYKCYSQRDGIFTDRSEAECRMGLDSLWKPVHSWYAGNWTSGAMQPLMWINRGMYKPNRFMPTIDYFRISKEVDQATAMQFSYSYYSGALCRYGFAVDLVPPVVCDCDGDKKKKSNCFAATNAGIDYSANGRILVCPFQAQAWDTQEAYVFLSARVFPAKEACKILEIKTTPIGVYGVPDDNSVTRTLFQKAQPNPYLVVVNKHGSTIGQIVSNAVNLSFDFTAKARIKICIYTQPVNVVNTATTYRLAQQLDNAMIEVIDDPKVEYNAAGSNNSAPDSSAADQARAFVCGYVSKPGIYFAAKVVDRYARIDNSGKINGQSIAALILYGLLFAFAVAQLILLILDRRRQRLLPFKIAALTVVMLATIVRAIAVQPATLFKRGDESVEFVVFELPTFLYFSVFTFIVYLWLLVVITTNNFGNRHALSLQKPVVKRVFIILNLIMYALFIVFIFLLAILPASDRKSQCYRGNMNGVATSNKARSIKIAYWVIQLIISTALAIGFLIAAIGLLRIVYQLRKTNLGRSSSKQNNSTPSPRPVSGSRDSSNVSNSLNSTSSGAGAARTSTRSTNTSSSPRSKAEESNSAADVQMVIITVVALVCVVFLLIRAAVFLWAALTGVGLPVIVFCLLEVVPQTMLVFYLHPFRCFREAGRASSTSNSGTPRSYHLNTTTTSSQNTNTTNSK